MKNHNFRILVRYVLIASATSTLLGAPISYLMWTQFPELSVTLPNFKLDWLFISTSIALAPLIETLLFVYSRKIMVYISQKVSAKPPHFVTLLILQTVLFAGLHSYQSAYWGLTILLPGLVFSWVFITWTMRENEWVGYLACALTHSIHNAVLVLSLFLFPLDG